MSNRLVYIILAILGSLRAVAASDSLTVLNIEDPAPAAKILATQSFTGNDPAGNCAYYELIQTAKSTAKLLGANLMKINAHKQRNQQQYCDEINVSFYQVAHMQDAEKHISWSAARPLTWEDFKGAVPRAAPPTTAAVTNCGIAIETNTVTTSGPVKVYVFNSFETASSWVRPDQMRHAVLIHEQGHFDICELYTRKMRERFSKASIHFSNLQKEVREIYNSTMKEYSRRQADYERETQHGILETVQQQWTEQIGQELQQSASWASS